MSISSLINRPCLLVHRSESGTIDEVGNDIPIVTTTETVCELQQTQRSEPAGHGEISATVWSVFFLPEESVHTGDAIIVDGERYELVGEPWRARNPRTRLVEHIEATARRVAGAYDEVGS